MFINEVCKKCSLTKKAVEYYEEQGLICPTILENGYRDFSEDDIAHLKKIAILRGLGLSVAEIHVVLASQSMAALQRMSIKKDLELDSLKAKQELIQLLAQSNDWENTRMLLDQLERKQSILNRLLEKFPGYYGKYITFHFAQFLDEPITTAEQQEAYEIIVDFLDRVEIDIPQDLREYLEEAMQSIDSSVMKNISDNLTEMIENTEQYLNDHKEMLEHYMAFQQSDEYKATPAYRLQERLGALNRENGYNDVFIPAMQRLSSSYRAYYQALLKSNEALLKAYPQILERNQ